MVVDTNLKVTENEDGTGSVVHPVHGKSKPLKTTWGAEKLISMQLLDYEGDGDQEFLYLDSYRCIELAIA